MRHDHALIESLQDRPFATAHELAGAVGRPAEAVGSMLRHLNQQGLVERIHVNPSGGRGLRGVWALKERP